MFSQFGLRSHEILQEATLKLHLEDPFLSFDSRRKTDSKEDRVCVLAAPS